MQEEWQKLKIENRKTTWMTWWRRTKVSRKMPRIQNRSKQTLRIRLSHRCSLHHSTRMILKMRLQSFLPNRRIVTRTKSSKRACSQTFKRALMSWRLSTQTLSIQIHRIQLSRKGNHSSNTIFIQAKSHHQLVGSWTNKSRRTTKKIEGTGGQKNDKELP